MAKVVFASLETRTAGQLADLLSSDEHSIRWESHHSPLAELLSADVIFVGGKPEQYLSLLRRVRTVNSTLPVIVIARIPNVSEWLDALEAGATDYCVAPFYLRQVRALVSPEEAPAKTLVAGAGIPGTVRSAAVSSGTPIHA